MCTYPPHTLNFVLWSIRCHVVVYFLNKIWKTIIKDVFFISSWVELDLVVIPLFTISFSFLGVSYMNQSLRTETMKEKITLLWGVKHKTAHGLFTYSNGRNLGKFTQTEATFQLCRVSFDNSARNHSHFAPTSQDILAPLFPRPTVWPIIFDWPSLLKLLKYPWSPFHLHFSSSSSHYPQNHVRIFFSWGIGFPKSFITH